MAMAGITDVQRARRNSAGCRQQEEVHEGSSKRKSTKVAAGRKSAKVAAGREPAKVAARRESAKVSAGRKPAKPAAAELALAFARPAWLRHRRHCGT
ncbi:hypothetical protein CGZ75_00485 [Paenibacillus herberti]|uniref:Uncharacterized protein n=1 Tax=Paenibacillus herberti TaxID=1619309 RepID=A0A229P066_9BACL|nr:hypothetical protein CGZ75_00485 [Paenibacillus herberti]